MGAAVRGPVRPETQTLARSLLHQLPKFRFAFSRISIYKVPIPASR